MEKNEKYQNIFVGEFLLYRYEHVLNFDIPIALSDMDPLSNQLHTAIFIDRYGWEQLEQEF